MAKKAKEEKAAESAEKEDSESKETAARHSKAKQKEAAEEKDKKTASEEKGDENSAEKKEKPKTAAKERSKRMQSTSSFDWVEYKPKDVEELVINLANAGHTASEIGAILRDQHGIPKARIVAGKTISQILEENKLKPEIPEDLLALIKKAVALDVHLQQNKKDFSAKRGYELTVSKIRRLVKYYHKSRKLPEDWRYSIENARLLVK